MTSFDSTHSNEKIATFGGLFKNSPNTEQMRDPFKTAWHTELSGDKQSEQLLKLIDFSQMNSLFDNFLAAMGLPVAIIDSNGSVLASSKWQRLCVDFHRAHPQTLTRCMESDRSICAQLEAGKDYSSHQCGNGLIDCAAPIVIDGQHVANLFIGQFFIKPPDLAFFKQQQQTLGFDEPDYFAAIAQVPVINEERLPAIMALLVGWAQQIATHSLAEKRAIAALSSVEQQVKERTKELTKSHALLQTAQHAAHMGHYVTDLVTGTWTNDAQFDEIFGIDRYFTRDFVNWKQILHNDDVQRVMDYYQESLRNHIDFPNIDYRIERPSDGATRWINAWGYNFYDDNDQPVQQVGMIQDITERKLVEAELRIAAIAFNSREAMVITDADCVILRINAAFTETTGYTEKEAVGRKINFLRSGRHDVTFYQKMWESIQCNGSWQGEIWDKRKNGEIYLKWLIITAVSGKDGKVSHYVGIHTDITERKATEEYINRLAFYDSLTQLPNRRLLYERLKHGIEANHRTGSQMAVLMMDLDKFKIVNDTLGHTAGDELLWQVAERIKTRLREVDMVARLGGDEFVVLLENISNYEDIARIAESIIVSLTQPFTLCQGNHVYIGVSIGIALHPVHGDTIEILMDNADAALYHAKDQGRGCFAYFSAELTQKARTRLALESHLRQAIEKQELCVYFQPQVAIDSGKIAGAEALVRWYDSVNDRLFLPNEFIALAEETGLILPMGEWVLRETCKLGRQWLDQGLPPVTLAVNVSPYQFRRCDINALVTRVLNDTGFPAQYLELEITESSLMDNHKQVMTILNNLHEQGVRLAIDDFGTGYSSLAYLKYFPVDVLKIDKTFIDDIPFLQGDMAITATIIAMADRLGFKVLAEGVETYEQLVFLQLHGCDMYQGYLYSKALPAHDFAALLAGKKNRVRKNK